MSARADFFIGVQLPRSSLRLRIPPRMLASFPPTINTLSQYDGASPEFLALAVAFLLPQPLARRHRPVLVGHDGTGNQVQREVRQQRPKRNRHNEQDRPNRIERATDNDNSSLIPDGRQNVR